MTAKELWGRLVRDDRGRIGRVVATIRRPDDGLSVLVRGRLRRCRVLDVDDLAIDEHGDLWLRPALRLTQVGTSGATAVTVGPDLAGRGVPAWPGREETS